MKQFFTVFKFEFKNYAKNKPFLIITAVLDIAIGVVLSFPRIQQAMGPSNQQPSQKTVIAVQDKTGDSKTAISYFAAAMKDNEFKATDKSEEDIKKAVDSGEFDSAIVITAPLKYTHIVKNVGMYDESSAQINEILLAKYRADALTKLGVPASNAQSILTAKVESNTVQTSNGKDQMQNFFYTYILIFALYMAILLYGQFVGSSVATEKSSRAMELLITSTNPKHLMFGKVLGAGCAGLLQFTLIFGSGFAFYNLNADYFKDNEIVQSIFNMPLSILLYAILFFILGFFIYAFMYGALGSLVSRMEELNTTIMPVTYLFIIAFLVVMFSMNTGNVDNMLMLVCSYIPFTSPMAMFVRIAMGNVAAWEIIVSIIILIGSTIGIGYLAAAIYRMGVLMYGKAPKPAEIIKMLRNNK
jgi:ABC-2 type transport system permease protein